MSEIRRRLMASVMEKEEEAPWDYLTFTCLTSGSFTFINATVEMELTGNTIFHNPDFAYRYSVNMDMGEDGWVKVEHINSEGSSEYQEVGFYFTMEAGESVQFKSLFNYVPNNIVGGHGWYFYQTAEQTGTFEVSGSPLSMVFGDNNTTTDLSYFGEYSFLPKFYNNNTSQAFRGLSRIKNPDTFLPSKVLSKRCYEGMFYGCFNLTNAPKLPAKVMANSCYKSMFYKCSSLREAPALPALVLDYACYSTMFTYCSNLVQAPVLPATTLATFCYSGMFSYCSSLSYIKMLAPTLGGANPLADWVRSVNSNGVFVKSKDATWDVTGVDGVPEGWTVITDEQESGIITFKMNGIAHYALFGMTWREYSNSNFNGKITDRDGVKVSICTVEKGYVQWASTFDNIFDEYYMVHIGDWSAINPEEVIVANQEYTNE